MNTKILIRVVVLLAVGAAVVVAAVAYKASQKEDLGQEIRADVEALVLPAVDPSSHDYVKGLIDWAHPQAYEAAFTREGLTGGTADARTYQAQILQLIIERAREDGQEQTVEELTILKETSGL